MARSRRRSSYVRGGVPVVYHSRSKFDLSYSHKTTGNVGDLLPLYCQEVYPGDSFKCDASIVARVTSSFLKPVIDNLFCDVMFFYVPSRTLYNKWAEIFGENNDGAWARQTVVSAPVNKQDSDDVIIQPGDLASYFGMPIGVSAGALSGDGGVNVLPFRAYAKIYNEWYRDENLVDPMNIQLGDWNSTTELFNHDAFSSDNYFGKPAKVSKLHDYFTSLLPSPQKGDAVSLPIGGTAPVSGNFQLQSLNISNGNGSGFRPNLYDASGSPILTPRQLYVTGSGQLGGVVSPGVSPDSVTMKLATFSQQVDVPASTSGLVADLSNASAVVVNDFRYALQLQKLLERDAIFGTRFTEYIQGHFGVTSPDARLQRSEFLGGRRFPINIIQSTQTSESTSDSPLGNVGAWSLTNGRAGYTKGFTEHGFVIGMVCLRQFHTYQQGVEKFWWRKNRVDYLDPLFTTIGYQPVFLKELYAAGSGSDAVFGYAPSFEDLRCRQNRISGQLASQADNGLAIWHFADDYEQSPVLGKEWIEETPIYVDRTLSVPSTTVDQFIFDIHFHQYAIRVMPTYGEPGLVDHH